MKYLDRIKNRFQSAWTWFLDLDVLEWALPIILAITAIGLELAGHRQMKELMEPYHFSEIIIFGTVGPIIIHRLLVWMHGLMNAQKQANAEIVALNRELENKVNERTAALAQRNAELDAANRELQQLDEMKSEFVSLVSHELRAPLTALNGGLEVALQSAARLPPASRRTLEAMMDESARLTQFVQTILDVSRLEAGRLTLNLGPVAVAPILYRAVEVILGTRREVQWNLPAEVPPVWADEVHYEQILRNLLLNADKYSPAEKPIEIRVQVNNGNVSVEVADHGASIPPEMQAKIFERFQRGHSGESAPPGWGLGLYFAKKLTEAQSGALTLRSPLWPDRNAPGSAFTVTMPVAADVPDEVENA